MITSEEKRQLHLLLDGMIESKECIGKVGLVDKIDGIYREITIQLDYKEHKLN